jgi:hypothetical protein
MSESSGFQWKQKFSIWIPKGWKAFNKWRKKYWLTRIMILLAIFFPVIYTSIFDYHLIQRLVRIACDAVLASSEPQLTDSTTKYYVRREIKILQTLMLAKIDENRNRVLEDNERQTAIESNINPDILLAKVVDVNLDDVVVNARKLDVGLAVPSAKQIRYECWYKAVGGTEPIFEEDHKKINDLFRDNYKFPDYKKFSTWRKGINFFCDTMLGFISISSAILIMWFLWLFLIFVFTMFIQSLFGIVSERIGALIALFPSTIMSWFAYDKTDPLFSSLNVCGFISLSCIAGCWAIRLGKKYRIDFRISLSLTGVVILLIYLLFSSCVPPDIENLSFVLIKMGLGQWTPLAELIIQVILLSIFTFMGLGLIYLLSKIRINRQKA